MTFYSGTACCLPSAGPVPRSHTDRVDQYKHSKKPQEARGVSSIQDKSGQRADRNMLPANHVYGPKAINKMAHTKRIQHVSSDLGHMWSVIYL